MLEEAAKFNRLLKDYLGIMDDLSALVAKGRMAPTDKMTNIYNTG